jgi:hypothetical protein
MKRKAQDISGQTFGRLVAIERLREVTSRRRPIRWRFQCSCGNSVNAIYWDVVMGKKKSCGCLLREGRPRHGMSETSEYQIYHSIRNRCTNPSHIVYRYYGGRGIRVLFSSFEEFLADVGPRPTSQHSIDRKNVNGHYEPGNVHWVTQTEQNNNKRNNHLVTWKGKTQSIVMWARELHMSDKTLTNRLTNYGWSVERSFTEPVRRVTKTPK